MCRLYWFLLRLLPGSFRRPFGGMQSDAASVDDEMYEVFLKASDDARALGRAHYLAFCVRETGGLLAESFSHRTLLPRRASLLLVGALAGFVLALIVTLFLGPEMYTSTAVLRETPQTLMRHFVPPMPPLPVEALLPQIFSQRSLTSIAVAHNLSPEQRERLEKDLTLQLDRAPGWILIRYRNSDRFQAQRVLHELISRIMQARKQQSSTAVDTASEFLKDRRDAAGEEWARLYPRLRSPSAGPSPERLRLDAEAARAQYESLQTQLATALAMQRVPKGGYSVLEMLDPASLPASPDISHWKVQLTGAALGAFAGMIFPLFFPARESKAAMPSGKLV